MMPMYARRAPGKRPLRFFSRVGGGEVDAELLGAMSM
jgi:hypothetical protein